MIMQSGQQLLLPANKLFIWSSLFIAMGLNFVLDTAWGRTAGIPDLLALVLVFWVVHQPLRIGIGTAFIFGICMDVQQAALLGQHAWSYTVLTNRRLLWFSVPSQALQVLPLFVVAHALQLVVRMLSGGVFPGASIFLAPILEAVLWPIVTIVLLAPQRRAPDPDANRPL
jgi:rod shape-determining protein MreD